MLADSKFMLQLIPPGSRPGKIAVLKRGGPVSLQNDTIRGGNLRRNGC
jgi:hypothetical protein